MMTDDFDQEAYAMDLVRAINRVSDAHDAPATEKLGAIAALGAEAREGNWYSDPESEQ